MKYYEVYKNRADAEQRENCLVSADLFSELKRKIFDLYMSYKRDGIVGGVVVCYDIRKRSDYYCRWISHIIIAEKGTIRFVPFNKPNKTLLS